MKNSKEKIMPIEFYSPKYEIRMLIDELKKDNKTYFKLIEALKLLGNFCAITNVELFEKIKNDDEEKIILCCSDINKELFLFYGKSTDRKDLLRITKITNNSEKNYDISLAKKFELTNDNISHTISGKEYNFKYGRLITDEEETYSLFLGDNISYQIDGTFSTNASDEILKGLNQLEKVPTLHDFAVIIEKSFQSLRKEYSVSSLSSYKNFNRVVYLDLDNTKSNTLILSKK